MDLDCLSNGKQSLAVNLKEQKGLTLIRRLCKTCDVLLEPFRKGVMESLGLGPNVLLKDNPKLIYARLTGFGQNGPFCRKGGHDINYLAMSGLLSLIGRFGENPIPPVNIAADFGGGGLMCALGIMLALFEREKSGLGQIVDCDMVSGAAYLGSWLFRSQNMPIWGNTRGKNILDTGAHFYEIYKTKDGKFMSVGALEPKFYAELLKGLNLKPEDVPQFESFEENKRLFAKIFEEKTQNEWCEIFRDLDACVVPVLSLKDAPKHPHNVERGSFVAENPAPAPKLSRTSAKPTSLEKKANLGEHTELVLKQLNYSEDEVTQMEREGIIGVYRAAKL